MNLYGFCGNDGANNTDIIGMKIKKMNFMTCILPTLLLTTAICQGSADIRLQEDQIVLRCRKYGVSVTATRSAEKLASVELQLGDVRISIPRSELQRFKYPDLRSVSINTHSSTGGDIPETLPRSYTIIGMRYGGTVEHGSRRHPLVVRPYVLFYFKNGKYTGWRIAEPQGNWENKWMISDKDKDKPTDKGVISEMRTCPIIPQGSE